MTKPSAPLGLFLAALTICSCQLVDVEPPPAPAIAATVQVDGGSILSPALPAGLFGMNVEWIEQGNGMADTKGQFNPSWAEAARGTIDHIRWPGGTFSDYYHWTDGIGSLASRPKVSHHTDSAVEADVVGTPGIARWAASWGGKLLLTVNAGSGTAAEAAAWVSYCNAPSDARRAADGLETPIGVEIWEVGNELYLPHNPGTPSVAMDAVRYAATFNEFAPAMRAAVPGHPIRLMAIASASSSWYPLDEPGWLDTLLAAAAPQIDLVAVHNAYFPVLYNAQEADRGTKQVYQAMWASPDAVGESLDGLSAKLAAAESSQGLASGKIGLAITEWGPLFGSDPRWSDNAKTLGSAVYVARLFQVFAASPRLELASAFKFTDSFTQGWVGYDGVKKPIWEVFALMSRQKGNAVLASRIEGSAAYSTPRVGGVEARVGVAELTSLATQSPDGQYLAITLVNRSWNQPYTLELALPPGWEQAKATSHTLAGSLVTNHNGPDVRSWIPAIMYQDPPRQGPVEVLSADLGTARSLNIPHHAVVVVELRK